MKKFVSIFKNKDIVNRIFFTIMILFVLRIGAVITVPGVKVSDELSNIMNSGNSFALMDLLGGGALANFSVFALGVSPYITAQIIIQLLSKDVLPALTELSKQGEYGRKKMEMATRYLTLLLGAVQGYGMIRTMINQGYISLTLADNFWTYAYIVTILLAGAMLTMWLGDQITQKGFGNGVSILIFVNIVSQLPTTLMSLFTLKEAGEITIIEIALFLVGTLALLVFTIYFSLAERRVPIQYAGKAVGTKVMRGQSTHIPLSLIGSAVIAIIFAMSVMMFPETIANFFPTKGWSKWILTSPYSIFNKSTWMYPVCYAVLTVFFTWFYTQITFKPDEMAENLHKSAGFVPGVRPGEATEKYFEKVLTRVSLIGGLFAALLAVTPILISNYTDLTGIQFGGTSLLILIGVGLDFSRQLDSQLVMRHYQGFLK